LKPQNSDFSPTVYISVKHPWCCRKWIWVVPDRLLHDSRLQIQNKH